MRLYSRSSLYVLPFWQGIRLLVVLNELDFTEPKHTDSDEVPWNREDSHSGSTSHIVLQHCFKNGQGLSDYNNGATERRFSPYSDNGGSVVAIAGEDFCVIASDTRFGGTEIAYFGQL